MGAQMHYSLISKDAGGGWGGALTCRKVKQVLHSA